METKTIKNISEFDGILKVKVKSLSLVRLFVTPQAVAYQAPFVHGISQARVLEWVAISFSRGSSRPRDQTRVYPHCRQMLWDLRNYLM